MNREDQRIFDDILNNISCSNKFFSLKKYKTSSKACEKNIKRLEFNGYIDIVCRQSKNGLSYRQIVPQDCSLISSFIFHNKAIPLAYDRGSQDGILQTFLINELNKTFNDVYYIRNNNDKKTIFCTAKYAFYLADFHFRARIPLTFINLPNKEKYVLYDGQTKYTETRGIKYIPYYALSFFLGKLTEKENCK